MSRLVSQEGKQRTVQGKEMAGAKVLGRETHSMLGKWQVLWAKQGLEHLAWEIRLHPRLNDFK